jgi:hypothetical protein
MEQAKSKRRECEGFEQLKSLSMGATVLLEGKAVSKRRVLRSRVQIISPGPLFPVIQLRYWNELGFSDCRTNSAAI